MGRNGILEMISNERDRQDKKWGEQNHVPLFWMGILAEEFGEVAKAVIEFNVRDYRNELIQAAAVCVAALESLERNMERDLVDAKHSRSGQ